MKESNTGEAFELIVKEIFEIMGFSVEKDILISGTQIDLLLEKDVSSLKNIYIVECKDHSGKISISIAKEFNSTLSGVRREYPSANGVLITRNELTKEAKAFAESVGIQHSTLNELEKKLLNLEKYVAGLIKNYKKSRLSRHYVPLDVTPKEIVKNYQAYETIRNDLRENKLKYNYSKEELEELIVKLIASGTKEEVTQIVSDTTWIKENEIELIEILKKSRKSLRFLSDKEQEDESITSLADEVEDWLLNKASRSLIVLGDYGTGKTSFISHVAAIYSEKFIKTNRGSRCPFVINLKDFPNGITMPDLYTIMANELNCDHSDFKIIQRYLENGRFLLLLDGFDEMGLQVDSRLRRIHFASILKLINIPNSKVIITGRPAYFPSTGEMEDILSLLEIEENVLQPDKTLTIVQLVPFNQKQINEYIDSFSNSILQDKILKIKTFIDEVYNLKDLAGRPFLLDLIVQTIPDLDFLLSEVTPATLYDIYTKKWIDREFSKGEFRWLIRKTDKQEFMKEIAWKMLKNNSIEVNYSELAEWVKKYFNLLTPETIDYFSHDIRACTFLRRDDEGNYSFVHRSFMEFFIAKKIVQEARSGTNLKDLFFGIPLSSVTANSIGFILDIFGDSFNQLKEFLEFSFPSNALLNFVSVLKDLPQKDSIKVINILKDSDGIYKDVFNINSDKPNEFFFIGKKFTKNKRAGDLYCSFCGNSQDNVEKLIAGPSVYICSNCIMQTQIKLLAIGPSDIKFKQLTGDCSFCGKSNNEVKFIFSNVYKNQNKCNICDECLELCMDILTEELEKRAADI